MTGKEIVAIHIDHDGGLFGHLLQFEQCACFCFYSDTVIE